MPQAPSPPAQLFLGHLPQFKANPLRFLAQCREQYGDVVRLRGVRQIAHLVAHPDYVEHVLLTNAANYPKRTGALNRLGLVLGRGLVNSEGDLWRRQRRIIQPAFRASAIAAYADTIVQLTDQLAAEWMRCALDGKAVDVTREMMRLAFCIVGATILGVDLVDQADVVRRALSELQGQANRRLYSFASVPLFVPTRSNRAFRRALNDLDAVVYRLITDHRSGRRTGTSVLGALASGPSGESADRQIRDELVTLLLAGHENTGNALAWMWYLLALHESVESTVRAEVRHVVGDRLPTREDVPELRFTNQVVAETLRLYPTSWLNLRRALAPDSIGGFTIPAGSWVLISAYVTHRHPDFWPRPDRFDPGRFGAGEGPRHRCAYIPFGAGARKCIGAEFALMEASLIIATLITRFRLRLLNDKSVVPEPNVSLPPGEALRMLIEIAPGSVHSTSLAVKAAD